MSIFRKFFNKEDGAASVEGVIVLPIFLTIGFGIVDVSLLLIQNHKVGAGLVSAGNYLSQAADPALYEGRAKQLAISGSFQSSASPYIEGMEQDDIFITYRDVANSEVNGLRNFRGGDTITIAEFTAAYPYKGIGVLKTVTAGALKVSVRHEVRLIGADI